MISSDVEELNVRSLQTEEKGRRLVLGLGLLLSEAQGLGLFKE